MLFAGIISERYYHTFSNVITITSCSANAYLICVIIITKVKHIGPYRWLLLTFSAVDICISIVHNVVIPICHLTEFGCVFWFNRFIDYSTSIGVWAGMLWVFFFYQTFVLLAFHYVYRFALLCSPAWLSCIQRRPWRNWIAMGIVADIIFIGSVCSDTLWLCLPSEESRRIYAPVVMEEYGIDLFSQNRPGYFAVIYWVINEDGNKILRYDSLIAMAIFGVFFCITAAIIVCCLVRILKELKQLNASSKSRQMQRQLFRALLWQTAIPTFTSYAPLGIILFMPLILPFSLGSWGTLATMSMQLFPVIDPFLVLFFVPGYRASLPGFLRYTPSVHPTQAADTRTGSDFTFPFNTVMGLSPVLVVRIICTSEGLVGAVFNTILLIALRRSRIAGSVKVYRIPIYISGIKGLELSISLALMNYVNIFRDGTFAIPLFGPIVPYLPRVVCDVVEQVGLIFTTMMYTIHPATALLQWMAVSRAHWDSTRRILIGFSFTAAWTVVIAFLVPAYVPTVAFHRELESMTRELYELDSSTHIVMFGSTMTLSQLNAGRSLLTLLIFYALAPYVSSYALFAAVMILIRRRWQSWGVVLSARTVRMQRDFFVMQLLQSCLPLCILSVPAALFTVGALLQTRLDFFTLLLTYTLWLCPIVQAIVQNRFVRQSRVAPQEKSSTATTTHSVPIGI